MIDKMISLFDANVRIFLLNLNTMKVTHAHYKWAPDRAPGKGIFINDQIDRNLVTDPSEMTDGYFNNHILIIRNDGFKTAKNIIITHTSKDYGVIYKVYPTSIPIEKVSNSFRPQLSVTIKSLAPKEVVSIFCFIQEKNNLEQFPLSESLSIRYDGGQAKIEDIVKATEPSIFYKISMQLLLGFICVSLLLNKWPTIIFIFNCILSFIKLFIPHIQC